MLRLALSRLLQTIPVVIGVTLTAFVLVNVLPGNILLQVLGSSYTPQSAAILSKQLNLNQPLVVRYFEWLYHALGGDLGTSLVTHQSISTAIATAAPPTFELLVIAQIIAIVLGVVFAVLSVISPLKVVDKAATGLSLVGNSVPAFVTALVLLLVFSVHWHLVSSIGWLPPGVNGWGRNISAMILPGTVLALSIFPGYMRLFRREMYEQLENEEYVTLARMKGVNRPRLIIVHVIRNSSLGIITLIGLSTGLLIGGAIIVEQIFAVPGIGDLLINAINNRDATMLDGCVLVIAVWIVFINLLTDLTYAFLDPRVR